MSPLHAVSAVLLFLVFLRMTGDVWPSALVAVLFAVHPLHVESVAWVAERKDVLSGLFFMLTLGAYVGYVRHAFSLFRYLLVAVLFALGLMQANAGDIALRAAAVGLLAAGAIRASGEGGEIGNRRWRLMTALRLIGREDTAVCCWPPLPPWRHTCPGASPRVHGSTSLSVADCQRPGLVRGLSGAVFLSGRVGGVLSLSGRRPAGLEDYWSLPGVGRHLRRGWFGGGGAPTCSSAGSGIWECSCP